MDRVTCRACGGAGTVGLSAAMAASLDVLTKGGPATPSTVAAIYRNLCLGRQAWANRFAKLERLGLATSERRGRERVYTANGARTWRRKRGSGSGSTGPTTPGNSPTPATG